MMNISYFLVQLMTIILAAMVLAWLFQKISIPPVLGELCAGLILGPSLLKFIEPNTLLSVLAEIGVVFLLVEVGLHTDLSSLLNRGKKSLMVASTGFILPILMGFTLAYFLGLTSLCALFIGGTLAATSIGITLRVLADLHKQETHEAQIVLGAAIIDDIFGVLFLSVLYNFAIHGSLALGQVFILAAMIFLFMLSAPLVAKIILWYLEKRLPQSLFTALLLPLSLLLILIFSMLAHLIGAPTIVGGFIAGLSLSKQLIQSQGPTSKNWLNKIISVKTTYTARIEKLLQPFVYIFTPIFFVMVGVSINLQSIHANEQNFWVLSIGLLIIAFISKLLAGFCIKEPKNLQTRIGIAMIPRGEVGLIFASLGLTSSALTPTLYTSLVLIVAVTTFIPPFLLKLSYQREKH